MTTELTVTDGPVPLLKRVTTYEDGTTEERLLSLEDDKDTITSEEVLFYLEILESKLEELQNAFDKGNQKSPTLKRYTEFLKDLIHQATLLLGYIDRGRK